MRALKGAVVEHFEHPKTKREADIRLYKPSMTFFATITNIDGVPETFESKVGGEVREWLHKELTRTLADSVIDWQPVIEIQNDSESDRHSYREEDKIKSEKITLEVKRYFLGLTPSETEWRKLRWEQWDEDSPTRVEPGLAFAQSQRFRDGPKAKRSEYASRRDRIFVIPFIEDNGTSYLPYTPDLWAGLMSILGTLRRSRETLEALTNTKTGITRLLAVGSNAAQLMLEAPKKVKR